MRDKLLVFGSILVALMLVDVALTLYIIAFGSGSLSTNVVLLCSSLYLFWRSLRYVLGRRRKLRALHSLKAVSRA